MEKLIAPSWDAKFAEHSAHGEAAQHVLMSMAIGRAKYRDTAVDVGAHIGIWTRRLAQAFGRVHAFEPVSENYDCLDANVQDMNVSIYEFALGAESGFFKMILPPNGNSGCWYAEPGDGVPVKTLDELFVGEEVVGLIKLDVEGQEGAVLRGGLELLERDGPVVVIEDNGLGPQRYGKDWIDPKAILAGLGYKRKIRLRKDEIWTR